MTVSVHILWGEHAVAQYKARRLDNSVKLAHAAYEFESEKEAQAFLLGISVSKPSSEWIHVISNDYIRLLGKPLSILLHEAALSGNTQALSTLLRTGVYVDTPDYKDLTPLHQVTIHGYLESVKLLLEYQADANKRAFKTKNISPIHIAASLPSLSHLSILGEYIKGGFNIDVVDARGDRPLHYACRARNVRGVEMLLKAGAIPTYTNDLKETPLDIANNDPDLMKVFEENIRGKIDINVHSQKTKKLAKLRLTLKTGNK